MARRALTDLEKVLLGGGSFHRYRHMPRQMAPPKKTSRKAVGVRQQSRRGRSEEKDAG